MDELLKALVDAVRAGTALAMPALIGWLVVKVLGILMVPVTVIGAIYTLLRGITRAIAVNERLSKADMLKYCAANGDSVYCRDLLERLDKLG